jgi:hypothetical protein
MKIGERMVGSYMQVACPGQPRDEPPMALVRCSSLALLAYDGLEPLGEKAPQSGQARGRRSWRAEADLV